MFQKVHVVNVFIFINRFPVHLFTLFTSHKVAQEHKAFSSKQYLWGREVVTIGTSAPKTPFTGGADINLLVR